VQRCSISATNLSKFCAVPGHTDVFAGVEDTDQFFRNRDRSPNSDGCVCMAGHEKFRRRLEESDGKEQGRTTTGTDAICPSRTNVYSSKSNEY